MKKLSISEMTVCGIFTALLCVLAPMTIPIGPVPISLTNFVLYISIIVLGTKLSTISYIIYLLIGLVGLPVFSGYVGGPSKFVGPTGGYLVGFVFLTIIGGIIYEHFKGQPIITGLGMFLGLVICYAFGTVWFMKLMSTGLAESLTMCVWPFIPLDIVKIVLGVFLGTIIKRSLNKAGLLTGGK